MPDRPVETADAGIRISDAAARRIAALIKEDGNPAALFRVAVAGGGCSGFQYGFSLDDKTTGEDRLFRKDDVAVVIDETSLELLSGSEVDYVEDLIGSYFAIKNPNAASTCGCGSSFSL